MRSGIGGCGIGRLRLSSASILEIGDFCRPKNVTKQSTPRSRAIGSPEAAMPGDGMPPAEDP